MKIIQERHTLTMTLFTGHTKIKMFLFSEGRVGGGVQNPSDDHKHLKSTREINVAELFTSTSERRSDEA